ncbi:MAG: hypothetical protein U0414_32385 [Polyangiaceae bacterium]
MGATLFSATIAYEEEEAFAEVGVTPIWRYDALGRVTQLDLPNGSFRRTEWTPWLTRAFDENDTVDELGNAWKAARVSAGGAEQRAYEVTHPHAATPTVSHYDPLGRAFLVQAHDGFTVPEEEEEEEPEAILFETRVAFDIESQVLGVTDALERLSDERLQHGRPSAVRYQQRQGQPEARRDCGRCAAPTMG